MKKVSRAPMDVRLFVLYNYIGVMLMDIDLTPLFVLAMLGMYLLCQIPIAIVSGIVSWIVNAPYLHVHVAGAVMVAIAFVAWWIKETR